LVLKNSKLFLKLLLADCGGLIGLFLGFSLLTIVDLIEKFLRMLIKTGKNSKKKEVNNCER
jgi:hypothetical protein